MEFCIQPYVRFAMNHIWLENYYINRNIWDNEFIFIEEGKMKITIDGRVYHVVKNDLVVLKPKEHNIVEWDGENCIQPHVHFDFINYPDRDKVHVSMVRTEDMDSDELTYFRPDFFSENGIIIPDVIHLKEPLIIKNILYQIISEFTFKKNESQIILQGLMTQLIGSVLRENDVIYTSNEFNDQLNDVVVFMNEKVDSNLSLDDFAEKLCVSKWRLIQLFNQNYGTTPIKYYNKLRHLRAKDLIMYSVVPINEIGTRMGFDEAQTFSRWFKNMDGHYPTFYRKYPKK